MLLIKDSENTKGGGVVNRENEIHKITRLSLSELAYYFQKRLRVHIRYNGNDTNKYNFRLEDFKNISQLRVRIDEHGLGLKHEKSEIEFIEIK